MGLTATCDEGEIVVRYNGKILQRYILDNPEELKQDAFEGGADYIEPYIVRQDTNSTRAPFCTVDQSSVYRSELRASGRKVSFGSYMVRLLTCKAFNIEMEVDPNFISDVWFGWVGYKNTTFDQLHTDLIAAQTMFKQQETYQLMQARCAKLKIANFPITNIAVLGNGSITRPSAPHGDEITNSGYYGFAGTPIDQLGAIMEISKLLGGTSRRPGLRALKAKPLPCIFQEPMSSKFEQKFLQSLGHTVVDDPDAFGLINENSLVVFIQNPGMEDHILQGVWPAAMVVWKAGPKLEPPREDFSDHEEQDIARQKFDDGYKVLPFMESKSNKKDAIGKHHWTHEYNFHLRKDLDGAADFSFSV